jgi:outer membrane protein assembly factor BamB
VAVSGQLSTWEFEQKEGAISSVLVKLPHRDISFNRVDDSKPAVETVAEAEPVEEDGPRFPDALKKSYKVEKASQWPGFRGAGAKGLVDGQNPPVDWHGPSGRNILWKTEIPGLAHSSPVIWNDLVFVTTATNEQENPVLRLGLYGDVGMVNDTGNQTWQVMALNRKTGEMVWQQTAYAGKPTAERQPKATHANSTPAVNEKYVIALFGSEGLYCYDHSGKLIWKRSLGLLSGSFFFDDKVAWGHGSSPIIYKDQVIVQCDRSRDSFLAAFSLTDGKKLWQTPRDEVPSWSSPTVYQGKAGSEILTNGTKAVRGYNPKTGEMLWQLKGGSEIAVPTPFEHNGLLLFTNGYRPYQPIYAIHPGQKGDISLEKDTTSSEAVAWSHRRGGPYLPTPIAYKDHLYIVDNGGAVSCYNMKDGERLYRERLRDGRAFTASVLAGDDKIYLFSEFGDTFIVQAGPEFKLLAKNSLEEEVMATPALTDSTLYIRARKHLYAIKNP